MTDVSRDQFNETNDVTRKVFQNKTTLMDADLNEQFDIQLNYDRRLLGALIGNVSRRYLNGFKVVGNGASLTVSIIAGLAAFKTAENYAVLLRLAGNYELTGFTTWTESRTDYVFIDIEEVEISPAEDPNIVNPELGEETCRDIRYDYSINISEGAGPGAAPAGHTYIILASITKSSGDTINASDINDLMATSIYDSNGAYDLNGDVNIHDGKLVITPGNISQGGEAGVIIEAGEWPTSLYTENDIKCGGDFINTGRRFIGVLNSSINGSTTDQTIENTAEIIKISAGAVLTLSSTPTISITDVIEGQKLIIMNRDQANILTLQDESVLTGSKIRSNDGANIALGTNRSITFVAIDEGGGSLFWHEISRSW